jgi:hypothetical protein
MRTKEQEIKKKHQDRAYEQKSIMQRMILPGVFKQISIWFGEHPWRILIPIALLLSLSLHVIYQKSYDDLILKIFGGFGLIKLY